MDDSSLQDDRRSFLEHGTGDDGGADGGVVHEQRVDWGLRIILAGVLLVVIWILAMPWVPSIAQTTMRRFQLQTDSFVAWSAQFPIPAMYNFANRYQFSSVPPSMVSDGLLSDFAAPPKWRYANHFPTRVFTFGDGRYMLYRSGRPLWVEFESRYRGQVLQCRYELRPHESDAGYDVIRSPAKCSLGQQSQAKTQSKSETQPKPETLSQPLGGQPESAGQAERDPS